MWTASSVEGRSDSAERERMPLRRIIQYENEWTRMDSRTYTVGRIVLLLGLLAVLGAGPWPALRGGEAEAPGPPPSGPDSAGEDRARRPADAPGVPPNAEAPGASAAGYYACTQER